MILTDEQERAKDGIINWYYNQPDKQVFCLAGFAGTGKTSLISYVLRNSLGLEESEYAFCTPTGKASTVLISKDVDSKTIHRLMYTPVDTEEKIVDKETGETLIKRNVKFIKKTHLNYKLIIVDEFSMVDSKIFEDLCSYNIKILAVGDNGQLPPVNGPLLDCLKKPDAQLIKILRQNDGSMILRVAEMARNGVWIRYGNYGNDVVVYDKKTLTDEQLMTLCLNADQVIAGRNITCKEINNKMRSKLGFTTEYPTRGDKIMCLQNNYYLDLGKNFSLTNGLIGKCTSYTRAGTEENPLAVIGFEPELTKLNVDDIVINPYLFTDQKSKYEHFQLIYRLPRRKYVAKIALGKRPAGMTINEYRDIVREEIKNRNRALETLTLNEFNFGYCISCHKSQGSEWDSVVIIDESFCFGDLRNNWLYTAITRAKKRCIIIK